MTIVYLASQYPAAPLTAEVKALRRLGLQIQTVSLEDGRSDADLEEKNLTFHLARLAQGAGWRVHARACRRPVGYLRALATGLRHGLATVQQALVLSEWMRGRQLTHLYVADARCIPLGLIASGLGARLSVAFDGHPGHPVGRADLICARNDHARAQACEMLPYADWNKVVVTAPGIDTSEFEPASPAHDVFRILALGPCQGQYVAVQAASVLQRAGRDAELLVVDPPHFGLDKVEKVAATPTPSDVAQQLGLGIRRFDRPTPMTFANVDVVLDTAMVPGDRYQLLGAMAMARPCIAAWGHDAPEIITHEVNGLLVPPARPEALAEAIARLMDDAGLRQRLGAAARETVLTRFTLDRYARELAQALSAYSSSSGE